MTIDTAKELQMNIAKEGLALLVLHPTADVQLHRECISHIGTAWDIPFGDTQEVISLLDRELDAIHAAEKNGTVTHVLPEEELPMNASGLETLDNIWDLFETSLRVDSPYARTRLFEMAKWLGVSEPAGLDRKDVGGKAGMDGTSQLTTPHRRSRPPEGGSSLFRQLCPL